MARNERAGAPNSSTTTVSEERDMWWVYNVVVFHIIRLLNRLSAIYVSTLVYSILNTAVEFVSRDAGSWSECMCWFAAFLCYGLCTSVSERLIFWTWRPCVITGTIAWMFGWPGIDTMYAVISTKITGFPEVWTGFTFWNVLCITCTIVLFELLYLIIGSFLRFIFAYGYDADAVAKQVKYTTKIVEKIVKKIVVPSTHAANASAAVPNVQAELSVETTATHTSADGISASVPVDTAAQSAQSGSTSAQYVETAAEKLVSADSINPDVVDRSAREASNGSSPSRDHDFSYDDDISEDIHKSELELAEWMRKNKPK